MTIRPALPSDLPEILAIEVSAFGPALRWEPEEIAFEVSVGHILVYVDGNVGVVGYAASRVRGGVGTLHSIAAMPSVQRQGIGSALVAAVLDRMWAVGAECVELDCNADLIPFYLRFGFDLCGFYTTGVGAKQRTRVVMRRMP